jgi:hypothetical protein
MDTEKSTPNEVREGTSNRADFHHGSTTQGGSNFGQGSADLGKAGNLQGSESNDGANYENEKDWDNEALRTKEQPFSVAASQEPTAPSGRGNDGH